MKAAGITSIILIVLGTILFLLQMWFSCFDAEFFIKMMITLGVLLLASVAISLIRREYVNDKKLKDDGYID